MSQHDFNIANQGFPATRADINNAFQAIASNSSGATAPATTYANMWWYDTANNKMYLRNEADSAWIEVATIDQTNNEWLITTGTVQAADGDGLVLKTDEGTARITIADTGNVTIANDLTVNGNLDVSSGTIKLDGNYPVGTANVALGDAALDSTDGSASYNVAIGPSALTTLTTGDDNIAIGFIALQDTTTGSDNVAVGTGSLGDNTEGSSNVAIGRLAMRSNTTASSNTGVGYRSLYQNTTGAQNTGLGQDSFYSNTTGSYNVGVGFMSLYNNTTASNNTAVGYQAGFSTNNSAATFNTILGYQAGYSNTSGSTNTFIGPYAGYSMTTGSNNTIIGRYNGNQGGLDIRTSSNNIVLSDGSGNPRVHIDSAGTNYVWSTSAPMVWGRNQTSGSVTGLAYYNTAANIGSFTGQVFRVMCDGDVENANNSYGAISDIKLKENIVDANSQWDDLKALQVRNYNFKAETGYSTHTQLGLVAQEVELVSPNLVGQSIDDETGETTKTVNYSVLYMKAVKALQEAMDRIETLEAKVTALENV